MKYLNKDGAKRLVRTLQTEVNTKIGSKSDGNHTHGNITNDGRIGTDYDVPLSTNYGGYVGPGEWMSWESIDDEFEESYNDVIQIDASDMEPNTQIYVYEVDGETPMPGYPLLMIGSSTGLFLINRVEKDKYIFTVGNKQTDTFNYYNEYDNDSNLIPGISNAGGHLIKIFENSNTFTVME